MGVMTSIKRAVETSALPDAGMSNDKLAYLLLYGAYLGAANATDQTATVNPCRSEIEHALRHLDSYVVKTTKTGKSYKGVWDHILLEVRQEERRERLEKGK